VDVVEDQDQIAAQLKLERLAERSREAVGRSQVLGIGPERARQRRAQLIREVRQTQTQRVDQPTEEVRQAGVRRLQRVPGRMDTRHPGGQQGRLAKAGPGDDGHKASSADIVEAAQQLGPVDPGSRQRRRQDLARRRAGPQRGHRGQRHLLMPSLDERVSPSGVLTPRGCRLSSRRTGQPD
jgi:hypothetical protein